MLGLGSGTAQAEGIAVKGKVALVTGGSIGIGLAAAQLFANKGAIVVITARRAAEGEEAAAAICAAGGDATFVKADVGSAVGVQNLIETIEHRHGRLDYSFNNAGVLDPLVPLTHATEADWDATVDINLKGIWLCMKHEIPLMLRGGGGAIVNTSSIIAVRPNEMYGPAYVASKSGIVGLTQLAALQYAHRNIRVNAVCPGLIRTPMAAPYLEIPEINDTFVGWHPMNRVGESSEVAEAAVWLCSDAASFVTGQAINVDGGATAKWGAPVPSVIAQHRSMY